MAFEYIFNKWKVNIVFYTLVLFALLMPLLVFMLQNIDSRDYFRLDAPEGQFYYLVSKLMGLTAFIMIWWQLIIGASRSKVLNVKQHIIIGVLTLLLVFIHVGMFITASTLREDSLAWTVLMPNFSTGYYNFAISLGVIAFLFLIISAVFGYLRMNQSGLRRYGHSLVFLVYLLIIFHAYMIGSDTQSGLFLYLLYFSVISVVISVVSGTFRLRFK